MSGRRGTPWEAPVLLPGDPTKYYDGTGAFSTPPSGGVSGSFTMYDPEGNPHAAPTVELDFKTLSAFPGGWAASGTGDFVTHDINSTRPGALWARSTASSAVWCGKTNTSLIASGTDFCLLWRPWVVGFNANFALFRVLLFVGANGVSGWTGRHNTYGTGNTYSFERFGGSTASPAQWNMDRATVEGAAFLRARRVGTTVSYGVSPDGSYWQEIDVSSDASIGTGAVSVAVELFGSQTAASEGGLSVFRLWTGTGNGVAKRSGVLRTVAIP